MNNSNDNKKSEAERIAIEELLSSSDSDRVAIEESIKESSFVVTSSPKMQIIQPKPSDIEVEPLNYAQVLGLNIPRQTP
jgi:hypothetical protein